MEQIQEQLPQAKLSRNLPNAANLALWAWDMGSRLLYDFTELPQTCRREENWLKNHTESGESYTNAYDRNQTNPTAS